MSDAPLREALVRAESTRTHRPRVSKTVSGDLNRASSLNWKEDLLLGKQKHTGVTVMKRFNKGEFFCLFEKNPGIPLNKPL